MRCRVVLVAHSRCSSYDHTIPTIGTLPAAILAPATLYLLHLLKVLSLLLVTHDRSFLERTCGEILELDNAAVYSYQVRLLHLLYSLRLCLLCCRLLLPGTYSHSSFSLELDNAAVYFYQTH